MTSQSVQQYVRIFLYWAFGALASYGVTTPDSTKTLLLSIGGFAANLVWTVYGTRLNALLQQVKEKSGVQEVQIKVNPELLEPAHINANTPIGVTAVPAKVSQ